MTSTSTATDILSGLAETRGWQEDLYRDLHRHPELSHQETRTAAAVAQRLRDWGYETHGGVGGTGVVGTLSNGAGPTVLMRADMDALPVAEATGLPYASTVTATDADGAEVPVMHACGHDVHVTCLLGAAQLLAANADRWSGNLVLVFQPAEELGDGARGMVDDGLAALVGKPDVALAQHVLALPAGQLGTHAGTKSNVIADRAVIRLNIRTYDAQVRTTVLDAIRRIVTAECQASGSPKDPEFELYDRFPITDNDGPSTDRLASAFAEFFGDRASTFPPLSASEDFSDIPNALGVPYTYWGIGGTDPDTYRAAEEAGRIAQDIPVNHAATFAPVVQPTLDTGTQALVVAALAWLGE